MLHRSVKELMIPSGELALSPATSVGDAAKLMAGSDYGAVVVVEGECLVGIFTERDALFRVIAKGLDPRTTPLSAVMTGHPVSVAATSTYGYAMVLMQEQGFRHLPVIENGRPIGIVSARNAMDPELEDFVSEERRRECIRGGRTITAE